MRLIGYYAFGIGQVVSLACIAVLLHSLFERDTGNHAVFTLATFALIGQLPLLFLLRMKLVETGKTLGQFAKDAVVPLLPWKQNGGQQ